jgi:formate dehydrogenase alpha subunit
MPYTSNYQGLTGGYKMIEITINNKLYKTDSNKTILQVCLENNIDIPTLCYEKGLKITASCRLCVVELVGRNNLETACSTPVNPNMVILTESPKVIEARREILRLLLANHELQCFTCHRNGDCRLQDYCYRYDVHDTHYTKGSKTSIAVDDSNNFFVRDYAKCILCGKCVSVCSDINGAHAIDYTKRGYQTKITSSFDENLENTSCNFCGMCIQVCPVAALVTKSEIGKGRSWEVNKVKTTCSYCGVGCQLKLKVKNNKIIGVTSDNSGSNMGHLCVKGQFGWEYVHSEHRIKNPLIKDKSTGNFIDVSWEQVIDIIYTKLSDIITQHGGEAIAGLCSAKSTNEENYLFQKLFRTAFESNNIDHCARLCHSSSVTGLATAFGSGAMTNSYNELLVSNVILITGTNTTEAHPVIGYRIKQAVKSGTKLIVIDPRKIELVDYADYFLQIKPGTNVALFNGIAHIILKENLANHAFIDMHTEGYAQWVNSIATYTPEIVANITGISIDDLNIVAKLYATADKATILYAMGITQHSSGTNNVQSLANLALVTGHIGREGTGVNPLRGQNNVQGACDMGGLPNYLPGYTKIDDNNTREKFEQAWEQKIATNIGLTLTEMFDAVLDNKIKAMYIMGENPVIADPNSKHVEEALECLDFLIVQDIFLTETAMKADVVLPAVTFAEKDGTFTNTERCIQRVRKAIPEHEDAKADWKIIQLLANRFNLKWHYLNPAEIMEEISSLVPQYEGISYDRIESKGIQWPCPSIDHPGTPILHMDGFIQGKGKFTIVNYKEPKEVPDDCYPYLLTTGRGLYHWHTGTMSRKVSSLELIHPHERMQINPQDAKLLEIDDGDLVRVTSRRGYIDTRVEISEQVPFKTIFMTFHFAETRTNNITSPHIDPISKIAEAKVAAVNITKIIN